MTERQAHHAGVAATQLLYRLELGMLDGVGAGLVQRVAGSDVVGDLFIAVRSHRHLGDAQVCHQTPILHAQDGDGGADPMAVSAQISQYFGGLGPALRLAEDVFPIYDGCICGQDEVVFASVFSAEARFALGQAQDVVSGCFTRPKAFVHFGGHDGERPAGQRQQLSPARRIGGQHQVGFLVHGKDSNILSCQTSGRFFQAVVKYSEPGGSLPEPPTCRWIPEEVVMKELKERILRDGKNLGNGILKVDSFVNHQVDPQLMDACGRELARRFADLGATKILTAEISGIAPALTTALHLGLPVVYARKTKPVTMTNAVLLTLAPSHTKGVMTELLVAPEYLAGRERILIIDDFLASGATIMGLVRLAQAAGATIVGVGTLIEKTFEGGRAALRPLGVPVESLVCITSMEDDNIIFGECE